MRGRRGIASTLAVALVLAVAIAAAVAAALEEDASRGPAAESEARVERVVDGDTLVLAGGERVRLVQIDAPELDEGECYARRSSDELAKILPPGERVVLEADPALDRVDSYGRLLRYVFKRSTNVNLTLIRRGAASVWFFEGDRGRYWEEFLQATRDARLMRRGLWAACPGTRFDPVNGIETSE